MKIPFCNYSLYKQVCLSPSFPPDCDIKVIPRKSTVRTPLRSSTIVDNFVGKILSIYNGKLSQRIYITPEMIGHKVGCFVYTKKYGKSIHNSEHNRKLKDKARRKITQKKVRKTVKPVKKAAK
jgi:ribosomal protein S19